MAKIGMMKPKYSVITISQDESGKETEAYGPVKVFGKAINATSSINTADAEMHADDGVAETASEFISGQLTMTTDDIEDQVEADVTGATLDTETGTITNRDTDKAPFVRLGYISRRQKNNVVQYRGVIFTKAQFGALPDDNETKGENIVFKSTQTVAKLMRNVRHEWRVKSAWMATEEEAEAWLDENLAPNNA